jgi:hypothetical protein
MSGQEILFKGQDTLYQVPAYRSDSMVSILFDTSILAGGPSSWNSSGWIWDGFHEIQPGWYFFVLFGLISFFAWIRLYYGNIFLQTLQASTNFNVTTRMFNDNSLLQQQLDNLLYTLYFFCGGFLMYLLEIKTGFLPFDWTGFRLFLFNIAMLAGIFFTRLVLIYLVGFLFNRVALFRELLYNTFIFNKLTGILLLPVLLFMVYTGSWLRETLYVFALATVAVVIAMRIIRGIVFSFRKDISKFYLFLYLCALEIAPLILLWRWLQGVL